MTSYAYRGRYERDVAAIPGPYTKPLPKTINATYLDKKQIDYKKDIPFYKDIKTGPSYIKPREPISFREKVSYRNQEEWERTKPPGQYTKEGDFIKESIKKARQERMAKEKELISRRENYNSKGPLMSTRADPPLKDGYDTNAKDDFDVPKEPAIVLDKGYPDISTKFGDGGFYNDSGIPSDMIGSMSPRKGMVGKSFGKLEVADEIAIMLQRKGVGVKDQEDPKSAGGPASAIRIDDLKDDFLICENCKREYDEKTHIPRVLPCLHTYCQRCLGDITRDWTVACPTCKSQHHIPGDSVANFPKDNTRRSLRDFVHLKKKGQRVACRDCPDSGVAAFFCKDCYSFMCHECRKAHLRNFMSRNHNIVLLDQIQNSGIEPFLRNETCDRQGHDGQPLVYFCVSKTCNKPVCKMCTVLEHQSDRGHMVRRLGDAYEDHKEQVSNLVKQVEDKITLSKTVMIETEDEMRNLDKKQTDITKEIDHEIDEGVHMLEVRRRELKDTLKEKCKKKRGVLQSQREGLKYNLSLMSSAKEFTSHIMTHSMPAEFVLLTDTLRNRLVFLRDNHIDSCPLENSFIAFDKDKMGAAFKQYIIDMGKIRSTAIFPPKTLVEAMDVPVENEAEVLKVFLYDSKGTPQKDSFDCVLVDIKDPKGRMHPATVEDSKTLEGCYRVYYTANMTGAHIAYVRVLGRLVREEGFPFLSKSPGEIDKRFGDILCPGFLFDSSTAHSEREVSGNGRMLKSDITTLKKNTTRHVKKFKAGKAFPWDDPSQDTGRTEKGKLLDESDAKKLRKYCGVIGTRPFRDTGRYYYEAMISFRIHVNLVRNALIFEVGLGRWDSIHASFYVGAQSYAWSFSAERCNEHKQLCHKFRHKRTLLLHSPLSSDTAGTVMTMTYGFLVDVDNRQWSIIDNLSQKILYSFRNLDFSEPLWPVFGTYNPYSAHVEMHLKSGSSVGKIPAIATLI
ncbi:Hypothetical predicted protein [Mytilus galloprovincialis]|uniref:RING-type E3 ubiquitin transferase n=1 Tax=Mytilus galloprovincialis TaxID=29158 RepID=A0A8B6FYQ4_MYTGA|nr:Hypothetical predicted protein [Mytilus galloprovincialis]